VMRFMRTPSVGETEAHRRPLARRSAANLSAPLRYSLSKQHNVRIS